MSAAPTFVDPRQVRRNYARAAQRYDEAAVLQREINSRMLERLDYVKIVPARILDLGCGTGSGLPALSERYPKSQVLGTDLSESMLQAGRGQRNRLRWLLPFLYGHRTPLAVADAQALPFASGSFGLIWSNLLLHWLDHPLPAFREAHRTLETGGLLMFSTVGPDTLKELRSCFDDEFAHTQRFADMHDLGDMLIESGFADPVMDVERLTLTYADVSGLLRDLRQSGAACAMQARRRGLMGKQRWWGMRKRYEALLTEGRLPATVEIVYGHAWKAQPRKTADGRDIVRFDRRPRA